MKVRPIFIGLIAILLAGVGLFGFGRFLERRDILRVAYQKPLELPRSAAFFPRKTFLTAHFFLDLRDLPDYVDFLSSKRSRHVAQSGISKLINGSFALADIDFDNEFKKSMGSQVSLAILGGGGTQNSSNWLLAVSGFEKPGGAQFLQEFWGRRASTGFQYGTDQYQGIQINTSQNNSLSTALIDEDLILISSERSSLEYALDISNEPNRQQLTDPRLGDAIAIFKKGSVLLSSSASGANDFLGLPNGLVEGTSPDNFYANLKIDSSDIIFESISSLDLSPEVSLSSDQSVDSLVDSIGGSPEALVIINSPRELIGDSGGLGELFISQLTSLFLGDLFDIGNGGPADVVFKEANGPLVLIKEPKGWVLGVTQSALRVSKINSDLVSQGFISSDISLNSEPLRIWTKLILNQDPDNLHLVPDLAVALDEENGFEWWGQTIAALQQRKGIVNSDSRLRQIKAIQGENEKSLTEIIALGSELSQMQLQKWRTWSLMQALAGSSFTSIVKGLVVAVDPVDFEGISGMHIQARLSLG